MSRMADLMMDVEDLYVQGLSTDQIAEVLMVPLDVVMDAVTAIRAQMEMVDEERDQFLSDAEADGDALASCGWGVDEAYVMDNDYFDGEF